jgi:hypothetical protein
MVMIVVVEGVGVMVGEHKERENALTLTQEVGTLCVIILL